MEVSPHVTFVCVRNRVRSTFAEFYLEDFFRKRGEDATVSSAGFMPQVLKDQLAGADVPLPEPFFNRPMSELTRAALRDIGISVPENWRSKELSPEMVDAADLIITALAAQKQELCDLYEGAGHKIFSIREMSEKEGYLFFEDFSALPLDQNYWYYAEEEPKYVSKTLQVWEKTLKRAIPNITKRLGMGGENSQEKSTSFL